MLCLLFAPFETLVCTSDSLPWVLSDIPLAVQGPISINVMAGAGGVLSNNIQGNALIQREMSSPRMIPHQRGVLKTLV